MTTKHIHIIVFDIPYPATYGGAIDVFYRIKSLAQLGIAITLHCFYKDELHHYEQLESLCRKVYYYPRHTTWKQMLHMRPYAVVSRRDQSLLKHLLQDNDPILFEGLVSCDLLSHPLLANRKKYLRECNIEHDYYYALSKAARSCNSKLYFLVDAIRLRFFERNVRYASAVFAIAHQDEQHFWQFAVVDVPDKLKGQLEPLYEMHEMSNGKWPCRDNYQQLEETESEKWQYGVTYRMKLSLKDDVLTGTVTKLDGTPCYKKVVKLISPQATRIVRPGLKCGGMRALFERPAAVWGDAVDYMPPEEKKLMEMTFPPYDGVSYVPDIQEKATGFFRVQKLSDGRWWAIDPLGRGFVAFGVDHCTYYGHYCEALDKHIHKELNDKKFKSREEWAEKTSKLLKEWGFNLLTAGVSPEIKHKGIPHAEFIGLGAQFASMADEFAIVGGNGNPGSQFPNVFHPDFPSYCDDIVESRTRGQQNDPWLFGYFFDNELCWWGNPFSPKCGLFNSAMQKDASHTAKITLMNLLKEKAKGDINSGARNCRISRKSLI